MKSLQHLSIIAIISVIMLLIYASVQQSYRSNANDPQIQILHDLRDKLNAGKSIDTWLNADTINLETSLAVFIETYDALGKPISSSGLLNGKLPQLPEGVIDHVNKNGEDWITWQPQRNVRLATGIVKCESSPIKYLVAGRSLAEVETRVSKLISMMIISWLVCVFIVISNWVIGSFKEKKVNQ